MLNHNYVAFSEYLYDKKALLVGNSTDLLKVNYGKWIDSHETVVRFNRIYNEIRTNVQSLGQKTNILVAARPVERLLLSDEIDWLCWSTKPEEMKERCPHIRDKYWSKLMFIPQGQRQRYKTTYGVWPTTGFVAFDWFMQFDQIKEIHLIGFDWFEHASIVTGLNQATKWHKPEIEKQKMLTYTSDRIKIWQTKTSTDSETPTLLEA